MCELKLCVCYFCDQNHDIGKRQNPLLCVTNVTIPLYRVSLVVPFTSCTRVSSSLPITVIFIVQKHPPVGASS